MACNLPRWNWLIQGTYNNLPPIQRGAVMSMFLDRGRAVQGVALQDLQDDVILYDIMVELGIQIKGTDPGPPKIILPTQAGADEYDQIMIDLESVGL